MSTWSNHRCIWLLGHLMAVMLFLILLHGLIPPVCSQGEGMVPLSGIIDHPVDKGRKASSHKSGNEKETYDPRARQKAGIHIQIAKTRLREKIEVDDDTESGKVFRQDKSPDLQNPLRHVSDQWLLVFLLEQYRVSDTVDEKVEILQNLENFSHKFENGRDLFKSTTAVKYILIPALNSSETEIRKAACAVFAVAAQNNAIVQRIANDAGAIRSLVHIMTFDPQVRGKALFALSSLLRNFPAAQAKFIHERGIPALMKVAFSFETRKRSISLVTDFLNERKYCLIHLQDRKPRNADLDGESGEEDYLEDPCDELRLLEKALTDSGWCDVLSDSVKSIGGFDTDDQLLTIEAIASSISFCKDAISPHVRILQGLQVKYQDDEDFHEETLSLKFIIETLTTPSLEKGEL